MIGICRIILNGDFPVEFNAVKISFLNVKNNNKQNVFIRIKIK